MQQNSQNFRKIKNFICLWCIDPFSSVFINCSILTWSITKRNNFTSQMTSWRRLKTRWRYLFKMSLRRLQNVCKSSSPRRMFVGLKQSFGTTVMNLGHFLQVWIPMSSFERVMFLDYTLLVLSLSLIWLRLFIRTCI